MIAFAWGLVFKQPVFSHLAWRYTDALVGITCAIPLLLFFIWTLKSRWEALARHRRLVDSIIRNLFSNWATWQLAAISMCAGMCEEALFRGALQSSLTERIGCVPSIALVSLLFGALHVLSWTYGVMATVIGVYFGMLFAVSHNLLVPIIGHAVYDLVALVYFLKLRSGTS